MVVVITLHNRSELVDWSHREVTAYVVTSINLKPTGHLVGARLLKPLVDLGDGDLILDLDGD